MRNADLRIGGGHKVRWRVPRALQTAGLSGAHCRCPFFEAPRRSAVLVLVAMLGVVWWPATGLAQESVGLPEQSRSDVGFALLRYTGGNFNPRPRGLPRLAWEIRKRTSIAMDLAVTEVDPTQDALYTQPLLVWQGDDAFAPLPQGAIDRLRAHLNTGGSLLVDVSDAGEQSLFENSVRRELKRIFLGNPIVEVPVGHVLYKSFYLVDRHGGRVPRKASLDGIFIDGRLAVVISSNDLAGAMARTAFGDWEYDVGQGGDALREMTFRLGLNWVMYALCLDYKEDQVHLPFILQRRH